MLLSEAPDDDTVASEADFPETFESLLLEVVDLLLLLYRALLFPPKIDLNMSLSLSIMDFTRPGLPFRAVVVDLTAGAFFLTALFPPLSTVSASVAELTCLSGSLIEMALKYERANVKRPFRSVRCEVR